MLVESVCANTKDELVLREAFYIKNVKCVNKKTPMALKSIGQAEYDKRRGQKRRIIDYDILNAKFSCECGGDYTHKHRSTHIKTTKHQQYFNENYEYCYQYEDGSPSTEQNYYASI